MKNLCNFFTFGIRARVLGTTILLTAATACASNNSSSLAPSAWQVNTQPGHSSPDTSRIHAAASSCPTSVVYVVSENGSVEIYDRANLRSAPCGKITGFQSPQGLFADSKGDLWVADAAAQKVYEFLPGGGSPVATLRDPNGVPISVAIDEAARTVYVMEYQNNVNPTTLVEVYSNGSTLPTSTLSDPNARNGAFGAVDEQGNLYVTFMTQSNHAQVDKWARGTGTPRNLGLHLVSAGAIITTKSGALAVCDPFAFRCGIFAPGSTKMSHVFAHLSRFGGNGILPEKRPFLHPDALALDRDERRAYVAASSLSEWAFPGPKDRPNHLALVEIRVPGGAGHGVAVTPASKPGAPY